MSGQFYEPKVRVNVLDENEIKQITAAALEVLERTGVEINSPEGRSVFEEHGCKEIEANRFSIPAKLVEKALETAPASITLYDRLGEAECKLEGWKTSYGTGSDCPFIIDLDTGERRLCTYDDIGNGARVCDSLDQFNFVMPVGIISDRPRHVADVHAVEASMRNTVKPIVFTAHNATTLSASIEIAAAVAGGMDALREKPTICLYDEPTSPMKHMQEATDKLIHMARAGLPVIFTPCPMGGATAPATGAGVMVQGTAECFGGLVMHQLVNPGAPIIFGGVMNNLDMSTTVLPYGSPSLHQLCAALTDIAHYHNLPMFGTAGCSDSKSVDAQAGVEIGFSVLMATLNGQNLIHDIGFLESALVTSYESYILTNEAIAMAKHIGRGITVNAETMATDVIHEAVTTKESFLGMEHTLNFFKNESFFPTVMDYNNYANWKQAGSVTMDKKLRDMAQCTIADHKPEPIGEAASARIGDILEQLGTGE